MIFRPTVYLFIQLDCSVTYDDATHTGDESYDGMSPNGKYSGSPSPFTIKEALRIEADVHKEYRCSDHFFVITSNSSYRPFSFTNEADAVKVVWNCDKIYIYGPTRQISANSSSRTVQHVTIEYTLSKIRVTTDVDSVDISLSGSYWSKVWVWMGADDDSNYGSDFSDVTVMGYCGVGMKTVLYQLYGKIQNCLFEIQISDIHILSVVKVMYISF